MSFELLSRNDSLPDGGDVLVESATVSAVSPNDSIQLSQDQVFDSISSLYRSSEFQLYFLGLIRNVNLGGSQRDPDVQLIDRVEEAQLENKVQLFPSEEDLITLNISKHGVKVTDSLGKEVIQRHPLHTVAQIVYYNDSFYKSNLALKIGSVIRPVYDCYVFQCCNEDQAQNVCQSLKDVFDCIARHVR